LESQRALAEDEAREERERALERRSLRRARSLVAVLGIGALVAVALTVFAFDQRGRAESEARRAVARELAAASGANLEVDPERSVLLAIEAVAATRSADGSVLQEAEEALHRAVVASRIELSVPKQGGAVDWSARGVFVTEGPEESGVIDIRDASSGESIRSFEGHQSDVNDVAFSQDGSRLATVDDDGKLKLWDPRTGRLLSTWSAGSGRVWGSTFSSTGSLLAAAWQDMGIVRVVDPVGGGVISKLSLEGATDVSFSPDESRLVVSSHHVPEAAVFDVSSGQKLFDLTGHSFQVDAAAWSPNGRYIATGSGDGLVRIWNAKTGRSLFTLTGATGNVNGVDWSPDSSRLVAGAGGEAIVWEIDDEGGRELMTLSGQGTRAGVEAAFSPNGRRVLTGVYDISAAQVWDVGLSGDAEWMNVPVEELWAGDIAFTPDGRRVVATSAKDAVTIWAVPSGERVGPKHQPRDTGFSRFELSYDGSLIATDGYDGTAASDGTAARVWDPLTGKVRFSVHHDDVVGAVEWSADDSLLLTASYGGIVKVVDGSSGRVRTVHKPSRYLLSHAALSPDGSLVALATTPPRQAPGSQIEVIERTSGDIVYTFEAVGPIQVLFDPTSTFVAAADNGGFVQIWNARTGEKLARLSGHSGQVTDIAFSPDGATVASGGSDGTIRLFDAESGLERLLLDTHQHAVYGLDFSPDGKKLASESPDGVARIWALDLDDLLDIARDQVTRPLTDEECRQYLHLDRCRR
jgi:WD40 repeat protein